MNDRNGNTICEQTDRFYFDPPRCPCGNDHYKELRGRVVRITEVVTYGKDPTVRLRSTDPVMRQELQERRRMRVGSCFPVSYLRLID